MQPYLRNTNFQYAVMGVLTVSIGTAVAILFIPDGLVTACAIFSAGLLATPILRTRKYTSTFLRGEHIVMLGLVYWLFIEPIQGIESEAISSETLATIFIACGLFAIAVWLGVGGRGITPPQIIIRTAELSISDSTLFKAIIIAFTLGIFYFAYSCSFSPILMVTSLGASRWDAPWSRGALGDSTSFLQQLYNFGYVLPALTVLLAQRKGWLHPQVLISVILSLVLLIFLMQGGGRRVLGVAFGAALLSWAFLQVHIKPKLIVATGMGLMMLFFVMNNILAYRHVGFQAYLDDDISVTSGEKPKGIVVDNNIYWLSRAIEYFPNLQPYVGIQPIEYYLSLPVPRALWSGKPETPGYDLAKMVDMRGVSLSISVIGELYVMAGLIAVFFGGLFFGLLGSMWNNLLRCHGGDGKFILIGLGLMDLFTGLRSVQDLVMMSYGIICWIILAGFIVGRRRAGSLGTKLSSVNSMKNVPQVRLAVPPRDKLAD